MSPLPSSAHWRSPVSIAGIVGALTVADPAPLYIQLMERLRAAIHSQALPAGVYIPAERVLADTFNVARITVRKAIDGLVADGLLIRRRGNGTVVASRVEKTFTRLSSFSEEIASRGSTPRSQWLSRTEGMVTPAEAMSLGLSPGSWVWRFQRLRFADGAVMALDHTTVPAFCLPAGEIVGDSLYAVLERTGCRPVRALQRLRAVALNAEQAGRLGVGEGAPGLFIERCGFLADGRACELNLSWYRADAYDIVAEVNMPTGH